MTMYQKVRVSIDNNLGDDESRECETGIAVNSNKGHREIPPRDGRDSGRILGT